MFLIPLREGRFALALAVFERTEFRQADGGDKFRLVERGLQAADGIGLAERNGHLQNMFGQFRDVRNARAAAAEENPGAQIIRQPGLLQILAR